jgi:type IV secretory pathway TraG/TraD family ATPase VirD4/cold shock CspA family protein
MIERHGKWLRMVLTSAFRASLRPRQAGEPSLLFMLDEIAALGHLKIIETMWAQVRGYGIQLMPVFQDLLQLKDIYKDRWESFVANAGALLFFRPNDQTTAKWLSTRLGETTRMLQTMSESENQSSGTNSGRSDNDNGGGSKSGGLNSGWSSGKNINTNPVKVPLTLPQELYGLRDGELRVFLTGISNGLTLEAPFYFEIKSRALRARDNPYFHNVPRRKSLPPPVNDFSGGSLFDLLTNKRQKQTQGSAWSDSPAVEPPWANQDRGSASGLWGRASQPIPPRKPPPPLPEHDAVVKSFDNKKGFGVVTLADGIAILHADTLRQAGYASVSQGARLRVNITQGQGGRIVSKVLSVRNP